VLLIVLMHSAEILPDDKVDSSISRVESRIRLLYRVTKNTAPNNYHPLEKNDD